MEVFFQRVLPANGDYVVLAIRPGEGPGRAFDVNGLKDQAALVAAVRKLSTKPLDLYVAVGSYDDHRKKPLTKRTLFLDLDAKHFAGRDLTKSEQTNAVIVFPFKGTAARELAIFCRSTGFPMPAIINDSGGGLHCYWPLDRDVDMPTWKALAESLKAKCQEVGFRADHPITADMGRVLRIPGTLNHKYGTPVPCRQLRDTGEVFNPETLLEQLGGPAVFEAGFAGGVVPTNTSANDDLSGGLDSYEPPTEDEVRDMLRCIQIQPGSGDWAKMLAALHDWSSGAENGFLIAHEWSQTQPGYVSERDVRYRWRSWGKQSANFGRRPVTIATLIKMAKDAGYKPPAPPEEPQPEAAADITSVEMPEDTGPTEASFKARVSSAVNKVRADAVAAATAAGRMRAPTKDIEDILCRNFVYVRNQDTYYNLENRDLYTKEAIRDIFTPDMPKDKGGKPMDPTDLLRRSPKKIVVDSLGFHPGEGTIFSEDGRDYVNKYVPPDPEIQPTPGEAKLFADFVDYLFPTPADQGFKRYWLQFLAHAVQRPGVKIATALLFISETYGIGKSTAACEIPKLLVGTHNTRVVGNEILERPFTGYLGEAHLLHLSEVHVNGHWNSSQIANRLKATVTDSTLNVHKKGKDDYDIPNRILVTATSNYQDAMYINSQQDRRWGIYELSPARGYSAAQHRAYFDLIHKFLASSRASGVLRFIFGRVSLQGFNPQNPPPMTVAKDRMVNLSSSDEVQCVSYALRDGAVPFHRDIVQVEELRALVKTETGKVLSTPKLTKVIERLVPAAHDFGNIRQANGSRLRAWAWRNEKKWAGAPLADVINELAR